MDAPITLSEQRREALMLALRRLYVEVFDEELSPYQGERLIEFFLGALGPTVYNQAVRDARGFMLEKLEDLDAEFYRPESQD